LEKEPKPDLDEVFTLFGEDHEVVARKLLESDEEVPEEAKRP